jgi:hypothetical protein
MSDLTPVIEPADVPLFLKAREYSIYLSDLDLKQVRQRRPRDFQANTGLMIYLQKQRQIYHPLHTRQQTITQMLIDASANWHEAMICILVLFSGLAQNRILIFRFAGHPAKWFFSSALLFRACNCLPPALSLGTDKVPDYPHCAVRKQPDDSRPAYRLRVGFPNCIGYGVSIGVKRLCDIGYS